MCARPRWRERRRSENRPPVGGCAAARTTTALLSASRARDVPGPPPSVRWLGSVDLGGKHEGEVTSAGSTYPEILECLVVASIGVPPSFGRVDRRCLRPSAWCTGRDPRVIRGSAPARCDAGGWRVLSYPVYTAGAAGSRMARSVRVMRICAMRLMSANRSVSAVYQTTAGTSPIAPARRPSATIGTPNAT